MQRPFVGAVVRSVLASSFALPRVALAQATPGEVARARELFVQAEKRAGLEQYGEACPRFAESQKIDPRADTLSSLALCLEHEGKIATAAMRFGQLQRMARGKRPELERSAAEHLRLLEPELPELVLTVASKAPAGLQIKLNGEVLGEQAWGTKLTVDPGAYEIEASAPGKQAWRAHLEVAKGQRLVLSIPTLQALHAVDGSVPLPADPSVPITTETARKATPATHGVERSRFGTQRTVALAAAGVGGVGVLVGTLFGLKSKSKHDAALDGHCTGAACFDREGLDLKSDARSAGNVSTAAFILGGAGLATGAALWFTAKPIGSESTEMRLELGPQAICVKGTW
jgi:hypothetical protein